MISTDPDPRGIWERMRLIDVKTLLHAYKIPFKPDARKDALVSLAQANDLDPMAGIEWEEVRVPTDDKGNFRIERYPRRKAHATAFKDIDYDAEIEKRTRKLVEAEKKDELEAMQAKIDQLTALVEKLAGNQKDDEDPPVKNIELSPYDSMKIFELKRLAKERGLKVPRETKKTQIIEMLKNGENAT